jgi:hypothetical protein
MPHTQPNSCFHDRWGDGRPRPSTASGNARPSLHPLSFRGTSAAQAGGICCSPAPRAISELRLKNLDRKCSPPAFHQRSTKSSICHINVKCFYLSPTADETPSALGPAGTPYTHSRQYLPPRPLVMNFNSTPIQIARFVLFPPLDKPPPEKPNGAPQCQAGKSPFGVARSLMFSSRLRRPAVAPSSEVQPRPVPSAASRANDSVPRF